MLMLPATAANAAATIDAATPIRVMHTRYEAAMSAANALDEAKLELGDSPADRQRETRYEEAMEAADAEGDALRTAIFYQVPTTWTDALILQYHITVAHGLHTPGKEPPHEAAALTTAIDTLFDFIATEVNVDHEAIGDRFKAATMRVWNRRRFRTAELEG
ncbi:hypothetical protein [Sphingomonas aracearum]|uniref:Uncharacterized protein n=1 Tax=Sphingomonas aracearum TaxID=2283317 RepID=A0A369VUP6_9SPHN|nr:hypothetical protein [Sphingomonas aracearum]RDE05579.1 hypothetical protein DVW87_10120 [Sphingomonas aracearum]